MRCALQIDVGIGDAVTPAPRSVVFPVLLADLPAPQLRVYPVYTVIAEKYHAMATLGLANSRMKDFYDTAVIAQRSEIDGATLAKAIAATFSRRSAPLPAQAPVALTAAFSEDSAKQRQWQAFLRKSRLPATDLPNTVALLNTLLWPVTQVAASDSGVTATWNARELQWR